MAVETRPELVGKRFLCVAVGEEVQPERRQSGRCWRGWRAGVIRAVSHRDSRNPDLAVRERTSLCLTPAPTPASQPHLVGLPLAPGSSRPTGVTPLFCALGGFAYNPSQSCRLPASSFPRRGDQAGLPSGRSAPLLLSGRGSAAASAASRLLWGPRGKAGLLARRRAGRWGWGRAACGRRGPASLASVCQSLNSAGVGDLKLIL